MSIRSQHPHSVQQFVDNLAPGTRVIWIANGTAGTVQPDHTIVWDNGHHMTRKEMKDHHALLIHSEAERRDLHRALESRLKCLKSGCKLLHWDDDGFDHGLPERLCPVAVLTAPRSPRGSTSEPPNRKSRSQPSAA